MNDDLERLLTNLPEPPPPDALKAIVMARIARDADLRHQEAAMAAPARRPREWLLPLSSLSGLAIVIAGVVAPWISERRLPDLTSPRFGMVSVPLIPEGQLALVIGLGLLVYIAGLFGPLRRDAPRQPLAPFDRQKE